MFSKSAVSRANLSTALCSEKIYSQRYLMNEPLSSTAAKQKDNHTSNPANDPQKEHVTSNARIVFSNSSNSCSSSDDVDDDDDDDDVDDDDD